MLALLIGLLVPPDEPCGNGIRDPGEVCDPGLQDALACPDLSGLLVGGTARCGSDCSWDVSECHTASAICGDASIDGSETCDPPGLKKACEDLVANASGGFATCGPSCEWDAGECGVDEAVCGDGSVGPGELCDDGNRANGDGCSKRCIPELGGQVVHYEGRDVDARLEFASRGSICWDAAGRSNRQYGDPIQIEYELLICKLPSGDTVYPVERIRATMRPASSAKSP